MPLDDLSDDEVRAVLGQRMARLQKLVDDSQLPGSGDRQLAVIDQAIIRRGLGMSRGARMHRALQNVEVAMKELASRVDEYDREMTAPIENRVIAP